MKKLTAPYKQTRQTFVQLYARVRSDLLSGFSATFKECNRNNPTGARPIYNPSSISLFTPNFNPYQDKPTFLNPDAVFDRFRS